jgi:hypothetical protein
MKFRAIVLIVYLIAYLNVRWSIETRHGILWNFHLMATRKSLLMNFKTILAFTGIVAKVYFKETFTDGSIIN